VGTSLTQTKTQTLCSTGTFLDDNNYSAIVTYLDGGGSNVFVGKVTDRMATTFTLHTAIVNGSSWSTPVDAYIILWST
jgi:hypothetical protein